MARSKFVAAWLITQTFKAEIVAQLRLLAKVIEEAEYKEVILFMDLEPGTVQTFEGTKVHLFNVDKLYVKPSVEGLE